MPIKSRSNNFNGYYLLVEGVWNHAIQRLKDAKTNENLLKYYVKTETNSRYVEGINELIEKGFVILGVVCDGRKGLFTAFGDIPVQMCQFHQKAIIRRYLTKSPKMEVAKELLKVLDLLTITDKESFIGALNLWYEKWKGVLNERTKSSTKRTTYTHPKLRSAYKSLKNNLPWLFTWYDNYKLGIPNTTNALEGHFSDLKNKLRNHNGLSLDRKKKFIDDFLKFRQIRYSLRSFFLSFALRTGSVLGFLRHSISLKIKKGLNKSKPFHFCRNGKSIPRRLLLSRAYFSFVFQYKDL